MPPEKTDALVIRLADFSESSRVVTFFTREFGKSSALAKGAKRLKGPFEGSLDLLSHVRIILYRKDHDALDLVTESQLVGRFPPPTRDMFPLYAGYYVAELLDLGLEPHDPHPDLFDESINTLSRLQQSDDLRLVIMRFELFMLHAIGQLPDLSQCSSCGAPASELTGSRFWVTAGGLLCQECGRPEYATSAIQRGSVELLQWLVSGDTLAPPLHEVQARQMKEVRRIITAAVTHALERSPKMLGYLKF